MAQQLAVRAGQFLEKPLVIRITKKVAVGPQQLQTPRAVDLFSQRTQLFSLSSALLCLLIFYQKDKGLMWWRICVTEFLVLT